jgi:hypothetical protein
MRSLLGHCICITKYLTFGLDLGALAWLDGVPPTIRGRAGELAALTRAWDRGGD